MGQGIANYLSNIINDKNIKGKEREMLIVLKSFDKENNNEVQVTINTIMEYMNTTNKTNISRILNNLNEKGYLEIKRAGGRTVNIYRFIKEYLIVEDELGGNKNVTTGESTRYEYVFGSESTRQEYVPSSYEYGNKSVTTSESIRYGFVPGSNGTRQEYVPDSHEYDDKSVTTSGGARYGFVHGSESTRQEYVPGSYEYGDKNVTTSGGTRQESVPGSIEYNNNKYINNKYINNNNNNNYINNTLDDVFINILKHWNSQDINNTLDLDLRIRDSITTALRKYTFDTIIDAISNYSEVYYSEYFYNIKWNINNFLTSDKGIGKFTENGDMWESYSESNYKDDESYDKCGIDIHDYIDF